MCITYFAIFIVISILVYHKFDNIVCPPENLNNKTTALEKLGKWMMKKLGRAGKETGQTASAESFELLSQPNEMTELCLHVYLDKYKNCLLEGHCGESSNLVAMVEEVLHVYKSLRVQVIVYQSYWTQHVYENRINGFHQV